MANEQVATYIRMKEPVLGRGLGLSLLFLPVASVVPVEVSLVAVAGVTGEPEATGAARLAFMQEEDEGSISPATT